MKEERYQKPKLLIMASRGARWDPSSPLLRFVRDHASVLAGFEIHATRGTYHSILATGLYQKERVIAHRAGPEGGVVEMATMVAHKDCDALIFFSDPQDQASDVPENRAIQRLCKELQIRLVTTLAGAEQWALHEAEGHLTRWTVAPTDELPSIMPLNWREGTPNIGQRGEPVFPPIEQQTLALISHDKKKEEMVEFVNKYHDFLCRFDRILTTGTTGYLLKLLFAEDPYQETIEKEAKRLGLDRFKELEENVWYVRLCSTEDSERNSLERQGTLKLGDDRFAEVMNKVQKRLGKTGNSPYILTGPNQDFADKIMPLPSGPKGGDVLIANEVLNNLCDAVVFLQDPGTAQPHDPDIRLFERTCQFWSIGKEVRRAYATCVSDSHSADQWAERLKQAFPPNSKPTPNLAHRLRQRYKLSDVILVDTNDDKDSDDLGRALARACAGYLHRRLWASAREAKEIRVGVGHGWAIREVLSQSKKMSREGLLPEPEPLPGQIIWSPLVGNLTVLTTNKESPVIANDFQKYYGGTVHSFQAGGFVEGEVIASSLPKDDQSLIASLRKADLIVVSASAWDKDATLIQRTALPAKYFPSFSAAEGTMSVVFLDADGDEVKSRYSAVGLNYEGFNDAAKLGSVILLCGGAARRTTALAALRARLVSVLITTNRTAEAILR